MQMQDGQMEFEQQEYQMAYSSPQTNFLNDILLVTNDSQFVDIIAKLKNDSENLSSLLNELKHYSIKNKDSPHLKALYQRIIQLISNIKEDDRYFLSEKQKNLLWIFQKLCCSDKIFTSSTKAQESFIQIFKDFTNFEDFASIIKLAKNFTTKSKNSSNLINGCLNNLFYEKYQKISQQDIKFVQTMKNLNEQRKLIIKVQILHYFVSDNSKYKIDQNQGQKIISYLIQQPYQKLFETLLQKRLKPSKQLRSALLKAKMEIIDDKLELVFGSKCQFLKQLKTKQNFQLAAKKSDGIQLIPQIDADSLVTHGDYLFTKWSSQVIVSAKQKVGYEDTEDHLNDGFLKILSFLKKIFQHRHKHIRTLQNSNKILEQVSHDHIPEETLTYFCQVFQFFVKYLSVNSLQINHRSHNLSQIVTVVFFDQVLLFFQDQLKKFNKPILEQTINFLITFSAHLFYRRDFQSITPITSKTSQTIIKILLAIESFPTKWNVLRNYKLVIDRWGQTVEEGSQDMKKLAHKFLKAYFNEKVIIHSKSNSTVFNPIFITRPYCKIFGSQFLKCIQTFQKSLQQLQSKSKTVTVSRQMDQTMSKIILFMSARVRFQDSNKIAEHLNSIYKRFAHLIPQIYLFRSWIMQVNFAKVIPNQISLKINEASSQLHKLNEKIQKLPQKFLIKALKQNLSQQQDQLKRILNSYQLAQYKIINSIQIKTKNEQYSEQTIRPLWQIVLGHIKLYYQINQKVKIIQNSSKQLFLFLKEQSELLANTKYASIFSIIQKLKNNYISVFRYLICNADKLMSVKDNSILMRIIGQWIQNQINDSDKNYSTFYFYLKQFIKITGNTIPTDLDSHLAKNQILGSMRSVNGGSQLGLTKNNQISFNQLSSLYQKIKPVYTKLLKLILQYQNKVKDQTKQGKAFGQTLKTYLQYIIFPITNIAGSCYFNGKIQEKSTQDMVLGLFWQQSQIIFKQFSVDQLLNLHQKYPLGNMLQITKNKLGKIIQIKNVRNNPANIFQNRPNRGTNEAIQELRQVNIPQQYIQIALQNIEVPDAQLALQWIQNNQQRMETLIIQKALKQSKQQTVMKPYTQIKSQAGKITQLKYAQFIQNLQKSLKGLVKSLAKQLFSSNGQKITKVLFVILQAFKDDFKRKQYQNFAKKMFQEINNLNGKQKFDDRKFRLILEILNYTMKKQQNLYKQYYKDGLFLKILSFVGYFGNSKTDRVQIQNQKKQDYKSLLQILNQTLPQWKQPPKQLSGPILNYLNRVLDVIEISNIAIDQTWQILYKISLLQNSQLNKKIIMLYSHILTQKQLLQSDMNNNQQQNQSKDKKAQSLSKLIATKTYLLPLARILLQQNKDFLKSNIQLQIKGYIIQNYKQQLKEFKQKNQNKLLEIDIKRFQMNFQKFVNNKQFQELFKKLFTKKKSKKNIILYDIEKHSLFQNQFSLEKQSKKSFISLEYDNQGKQILQAFLRRVIQCNSTSRQLQQQALIDLYKLLDYFKILIPTLLRTEWKDSEDKDMNIMKWLLTKSVAANKKKYQFMTFLAMNNNLFIDEQRSISEYVCNQYLKIIKNEIQTFISTNKQQKSNESINTQFQQKSQKLINILIHFIYLLQINKFNQQCFFKGENEYSMLDLLQKLILSIELINHPIIYVLLSESIFILKKRQMIQRLKDKYTIVQNISDPTNLLSNNLYSNQFLNMGLIYKVDPSNLSDSSSSHLKKKRNIFNGSNGRIIVDQIDDEEDGFNQMQQMDQVGDQYDSITNLLRMRLRHRDSRSGDRVQGNQDFQLYPIQQIVQNIQQAAQDQVINQQVNSINNEQILNQNQSQKKPQVSQKNKIQQEQQVEVIKLSSIDYEKMRNQRNNLIIETLNLIISELPRNIILLNQQKEKSKQQDSRIISQEDEKLQKKVQTVKNNESLLNKKINQYNTNLSSLIQQNSSITVSILPQETKFGSSIQQKPDFLSRLNLNDGIKKLSKFQKRFKTLILMSLSHKINPKIWENQYISQSGLKSQVQGNQAGSARWLMARLGRQAIGGQNRDQMIYHLERLINQRRGQDPIPQPTRPRNLNLNQAIQQLPEEIEAPKIEQQKPKIQQKAQEQKVKIQQKKQNEQKIVEQIKQTVVQQKIIQQKPSIQKQQQVQQLQMPKQFQMQEQIIQNINLKQNQVQKMQIQQQKIKESQLKPQNQKSQKVEQIKQKVQEKSNIIDQTQKINQNPLILQELQNIQQQIPLINQSAILPNQNIINQPQNVGPYRQILAMFGLSQSFLVDNGIDAQSFDCLPQQFQIDQITHYMNQAQNRAINNQNNQPNQLNQPQQVNNNPPPPQLNNQVQQPAQQQRANNVNDVLQQNIALFASMDPQTRAQMLADYPPQFLMQLPVQMRTEVQQFRQRQLRRIVEQQQNEGGDWRDQLNHVVQKDKKNNIKNKANIKYPHPKEINFNNIQQSVAKKLSQCLFLKVPKLKTLEGFRLLLENYSSQQKAIATILAVLNLQDGVNMTEIQFKVQQNNKGFLKKDIISSSNPQDLKSLKQNLLSLIYEALNNQLYKNEEFLKNQISTQNYLDMKLEIQKQLQADENGVWPLYQLLNHSIQHYPKLTVEILKRVKSLPLKLIKFIIDSIRADKLTSQTYKNLQFLSKNQDMKRLFMAQFTQQKPPKLQVFAKIIKYEFAKVPYLRKMHQEALNFYSAEYNEFLNQVFGIYSTEDIKQIQSLLAKHKHVHFQVIKYLYSQNRVLDKQPIGLILKMPHLLDFETKKYLFRKHPKIRRASRYRLPIQVNRSNILQQSFNQIMSKTPKQLQGRLQITFMDQQGYDAGGLTRQWLLCLSRQIFRPDYALFQPSSSGNTYQPNPKSFVNPDHLQYFKFIGRFVGKALAQNQLVDAYFTRAFYKMILGQQIQLSDLEQQDYAFYKSMLWLKQNMIEDGDYTFSYLYDNFGQRIIKDLIPGGRNTNVNEANKLEYIQKYCLAKMRDDFKSQMQKFLEGFHQIVPHQCISFFEAKQLELLISGLPEIDFEDLRNNVDYSGYAPTDPAIKWFWQIIQEFSQQDLARLIQFITGTSKIPVDGFANIKGMNGPQRISIHKDPNGHQLPKAHTCFNQLDLPSYETKQLMRQRIVTAITWGSQGFGFM